ncbi:DUF6238 family protein [Streptomyces sp. NBC_01092]|uniref:DUF6238 family protein n=1 Tax=Streptomyces sp. NBC_01092 TaxID=2903748 RepID=UPI003870E928|nr:DUF6238 family protein [Streptomyces sp. NBC_01092]
MNAPSPDAHPYLRASTAGLRHHTRAHTASRAAADRLHVDTLHAHLTAAHQLLDQLAETTRPPHPAAGRHLATAHTRLFQAAAAVHDAFHLLPIADQPPTDTGCHPDRLPEGPPVLTICQRHLAAGHAVRRKTTPSDLNTPLHGHTTTCSQ